MCKNNTCAGGHATCAPNQCSSSAQYSLFDTMPGRVFPIAAEAPPAMVAIPDQARHAGSSIFRYEIWVLLEDALTMDYQRKRESADERLIHSAAKQMAKSPRYADVAIEKWNMATNTMVDSYSVHVH